MISTLMNFPSETGMSTTAGKSSQTIGRPAFILSLKSAETCFKHFLSRKKLQFFAILVYLGFAKNSQQDLEQFTQISRAFFSSSGMWFFNQKPK